VLVVKFSCLTEGWPVGIETGSLPLDNLYFVAPTLKEEEKCRYQVRPHTMEKKPLQ